MFDESLIKMWLPVYRK